MSIDPIRAPEMVQDIAKETGYSQEVVRAVVAASLNYIVTCMSAGVVVMFQNFGKFAPVIRQARKGRNLRTGEPLDIPAAPSVRFTPSAKFLDRLKEDSD